jgi:hypothetical protein
MEKDIKYKWMLSQMTNNVLLVFFNSENLPKYVYLLGEEALCMMLPVRVREDNK